MGVEMFGKTLISATFLVVAWPIAAQVQHDLHRSVTGFHNFLALLARCGLAGSIATHQEYRRQLW